MSRQLVSRRSVARGVAWTVPVVAISVAAPAFAASPASTPTVDLSQSCKCAGSGGNNYDFKTVMAFTGTGTTFTVVINSWTFEGVTQPNPVPNSFVLVGGSGNVVLKSNLSNSSAHHDVSVTYTITNSVTAESTTLTVTELQLTYSPNCALPITCP